MKGVQGDARLIWGLVALMLVGCSERETSAPVVASVNGAPILAIDMGAPASAAARRRALDQAIARSLAAAEASRRGIGEGHAIASEIARVRRAAQQREQALLRDALFASLRDDLRPTEVDLRRHYEVTKLRYAERQVRLLWWPAPSADAARAQVQAAKLDRKKAETIGPVSVSDLPPKVVPEVFHLQKPGDCLAAGSEAEGFGVVELAEVLPAVSLPFERVRDRVEESWRTLEGQRAIAKLIEELRAKADIEIDEAALADDALWQDASREPPSSPAPPHP